ncbi:hypothetical protein MMC28_004342 [Mycoblastus sanguinarius]|nr:hypothetical protein [Mycoblastus sanguinarius]
MAHTKELRIVESLRFKEITERVERIAEAHPKTFDWLFEESQLNFKNRPKASILKWLRASSGIYWVNGRAGSGKSTLMKYFHRHEKTLAALETWAGEKQLVTSSFFFWHAGTEIQKSQQGLLQTLLYYVLRRCPQLAPSVCPSRGQGFSRVSDPWTPEELRRAFTLLKQNNVGMTRFCFFIDGLDEYEGDHTEIINIINDFVTGSDIKVCFSSRPWQVFENAYGDNLGHQLQLHELTEGDIQRFVTEKFAEDWRFQELRGTDCRYGALVMRIVHKARGVFLWVFLIVQSLRRGLTNCDTIDELYERLQALPADLEEYFQHMLDSVEKIYHQQAARIYQMCLSTSGSLSLTTLAYFDKKDPNFCLTEERYVWNDTEIRRKRKRTRTRVMARCTDLLEVSRDLISVDFLHRTVHDYLKTRQVHDLLGERAGTNYDADLHLNNAVICELKHLPPNRLCTPFDQFEHCTALVRCFMYHTHNMELRSNQEYLPLLGELDKTVKALQGENIPTYSSGTPTNLAAQYPEGWVVVLAIKERLLMYLAREKQIGILKKNDNFIGRPPLDIVLRPHQDTFPYSTPPSISPQLVTFFLELGADPNASHQNSTVWALFLEDLNHDSTLDSGGVTSHKLVEVLEALLAAGADPGCSLLEQNFAEILSWYCTVEDAKHIEKLRLRLQTQQIQKDRANAVSNGEAIPPKLAQKAQQRGFRRATKWFAKRY